MSIDDKIRDVKLQCYLNRDSAKISPLSSGKIDKYKYLTGEEILEQAINRTNFRKSFRKTIKNDRRSRGKTNKSNRKQI